MAEPTNKSKTISFAGRDIDQNEFNRRARQKAAEWAQYQGLKGDEITDFNESLNDILAGISDGRYSVTETGALSGKGSSQASAYNSQTGQRVDDANGGNSRRRRGFDPDSNVMGYLNGIAGAMSTGSTSSTSSSSSSASAKTMQQYISDSIFGEGNSFSPEQLVRWADAYDAVGADGKRGISGRRQWLADTLNEYRNKYNNGDFGSVSDDDKTKTNTLIDSIISNNNPDIDKDWQLSRDAPWLSHLLFRDAKYYSDESERQADEQSAQQTQREAALQNYINGVEGATNPYEQGTPEYEAAEQRKREHEDSLFDEDFRNHSWDYSDTGKSFSTQVTDALDPNLFSTWNIGNVRDYLAGAEGLQTNEYGQDVHAGWNNAYHWKSGEGRGARSIGAAFLGANPITDALFGNEWGHEDYTGWGADDTSLEHSGLKDYFDALPNDFKPDDTTFNFGKNARSNKAILGKAAADYARAMIAQNGEQYQMPDGSYLLPQFVDWNSGKAYRFHLNGNKATITTDNIGSIINGLNPDSPLYKILLNEWRAHNNRPAYRKEGGILIAAKGAPLSQKEIEILSGGRTQTPAVDPRYDTSYQPLASTPASTAASDQLLADQERYAQAQQNGASKQRREDYGNETLEGHWSGVDIARAASIVQDLGSIGAAFIPGYGTAAAGVLGIGSTLTSLGADFADKGVSTGQALTGLGINLAMDLASLIPGINVSAGGMKVTKNLLKIAPKLIPAFTALATGPEAIETIKKISSNGIGSITKDELRNLSYCISAVTGMGHVAVSTGRRAQMTKGAPKGAKETSTSFKYKNAAGETVEIANPEASVKAIREAGKSGQDAATAKLREITGDDKAEFANGETFKRILGIEVGNKPKVTSETKTSENSEAYLKWLESHRSADEARRRQWIAEGNAPNAGVVGRAKKFMAKNLSTNFEIMQGGASYLANPLLRGKLGNHGAYRQHIKDEISGNEAKVIEGLKTDVDTGNPMKEAITGRESASTKRAQELAAARDDLMKPELERLAKAKTEATTAEANAQAAEKSLNDSIQKAKDAGIRLRRSKAESVKRANDKAKAEKFIKKNEEAIKAKTDENAQLESQIAGLRDELKLLTGKKNKAARTAKNNEIASKEAQQKQLQQEIKDLTQSKKAEQYRKALESLKREDETLAEVADFRKANKSMQEAHTAAKDELLNAIKAKRTRSLDTDVRQARREAALAEYANRTPVGPASDYHTLLQSKGVKFDGATPGITAQREQNFDNFITFLKNNGQNDAQVREIIDDAALLSKARELFKFYKGGILKANVGLQIPVPQKPTPQTPVVPITGTLGNGSNGPLSGTLGDNSGVSGTLGTPNPANPANPAGNNVPGVINPSVLPGAPGEIGWGINPTDLAITALESGKYGLTQGINGAIYNIYAGFRGFHETPLLKHYRQWSAKPLEDQMARNTAEYRRMGARAAAGTTDQNQAFAWQLAATDKAMAANAPLAIQANEQIKTTVDQQNAVGNENFANMHEVGERNRQGDVALSNARLKAWADYLHKFGTTASQNIMARQYGMAKAGIANDERAFQAALNTDPTVAATKKRFEDLQRRKAIDPNSVNDAEYREAALNYREAASRFRDNWTATHIATTGTPYSGYGYTYKAPATFDFGSGFVGFARKGGKMEAAEREKTRREYEKIYHDSMKLLVTESNKKLRSGNAYAFYRKLFMHAK